jgi:hypothetical protein
MTSWLNACKWNATSGGTGDFVVSSAVTGYQTPAGAGAVNGAIYRYRAESADLSQWEVGYGAYTVAGTTQARTTILVSSTGGAKVSFSAAPIVGIVAVAEDMVNISSETQAETGTDNTTATSPQAVSQAILANARPFANIAGRNGGCEVWQRGTSVDVAAGSVTGAYTACDGWYLITNANQLSNVSRQSGLTSQSNYSCRVQRKSGQTGVGAMIFGFPLDTDEVKAMAGMQAVIQMTVSTGANWSPASGTLTVGLMVGTGTPNKAGGGGGLTGGSTVVSLNQNLAQGAAAATFFSTLSTAVPTNSQQGEFNFQWTPVGTAGANDWFQIDDIAINVVPTSLAAAKPAFERSPYAVDLIRCLRHAEVITPASGGAYPGSGGCDTGNTAFGVLPYFLKRAVPTITFNGTFQLRQVGSTSGNLATSGFATSVASVTTASWTCNTAANAAGEPAFLRDSSASSILIDAGI